MNIGYPNDRETRVYETNTHLPYHTDPSDVVGLLCLRKAKSGGISSLVSVASVYNEILENHPAYLGENLPSVLVCASVTGAFVLVDLATWEVGG